MISDSEKFVLLEHAANQLNAGIIIIDPQHRVCFWNRYMEIHSGVPATQIMGNDLFEAFPDLPKPWLVKKIKGVFLLKNRAFTSWEQRPFLFKFANTRSITGGTECMYQNSTFSPMADANGGVGHVCITLFDATEIAASQMQLEAKKELLFQEKEHQKKLNKQLEDAQNQLLQSEKMAAIGQLAAGVAHEINNPIGYVNSNIGTLSNYVDNLLDLITVYEKFDPFLTKNEKAKNIITQCKEKIDLAYLKEDLAQLIRESKSGLDRVKKIVQDLKDFSHVDQGEWQTVDLHKGIDSTLNVVNNEIKYKAEVVKQYGDIPEVECLASQINQVFMNLLVNAAHAIKERGTITIRTGCGIDDGVWVEIEDTGGGIKPEHINRIFEPFFTTKPVGSGTGLGLSLSYSIIEKHHGRLEVRSEVGKGTCFRVWLPRQQDQAKTATAA